MTNEITTHTVKCPYLDCAGMLKIKDDLPAGEYRCICHACIIRVSWAVYLQGGNKPYLTLVEKEKSEGGE